MIQHGVYMKRLPIRFLFLVLTLLPVTHLLADLVEPGDITRQFKVANINEFPDYKFYILYTDYVYEMGYKPESIDTVWIRQGEIYATSDREASSSLYAVRKNGSGDHFVSDIELGGKDFAASGKISTIVDIVHVKAVTDGIVDFEIRKEMIVYKGGKTRMKKRNTGFLSWITPSGPRAGNGWLTWILPAASLLILLAFWLWRRRQNQPSPVVA